MFFFVVRRFLVSIPILLASSILVFWLVTISGDPIGELRVSNQPGIEQRIATLRRLLDLDKPFHERYVEWLTGIVSFDFGNNREGQPVSTILSQAVQTTARLVILATVLSIVIGLIFGIITAVRQYSALDYTSTFAAFLFFSLPVFWLAVLLKEFGAIKYNDFLEAPGLSITGMVLLTVVAAAFISGLTGGTRRRRLVAAVVSGMAMAALLLVLDGTGWLENPGLSPVVIGLLSLGVGVVAAMAFAPLENRRVVVAGVVSAVVGVIGSFVFSSWIADPSWTQLLLLTLFAAATGTVVGFLAGGVIDRRPAIRAGVAAAFGVGLVTLVDRFISAWSPGRTIATIGPQTPNLSGTFWERIVDYAGHQILPSLSLALIGFATYMRYTRSSMLDTLKSDYVRTAKAKGLPATQVVLRHAFRTALIPVMTVVTISFATIIEGAVITERVFGWQGMGTVFIEGLQDVDPYPVMGFIVIVSVSIVLLNALADIMYAYLDPRIRR